MIELNEDKITEEDREGPTILGAPIIDLVGVFEHVEIREFTDGLDFKEEERI